ncbi:MAG: peptide deformylase [Candidatus Zambryskibacteria bacterium RIFOXYD1_FULL_40_13]|nr:MAG: hypothetical protein UT25_C0001G0240 [Parcubacteria group bacterium GW2011_GWC1_39_12]KKR19764.1 MAG: hypothetical protein UT49_C0001G0240 [Parcubacteria group bacterium GW2011_GWF1_39_37]KKR34812.1 MAG: hypothetical protein UT68_C0008G0025 [Parcubacteria group bacterium GW2011_GWC2_40_10]KKR52732.1 MAG: hypothetical protein UT89_C0001G0240 [Parcubacteria group bacterium GW2011_GWE1_40_20]KKR64932.1 MAG: hypothetical protein UU06_C0034G0006 [Parcubacteria group bacterium GW2011_GWB1_40_
MKKILQKEAPVLREICKSIPLEEISSPQIQKILKEMSTALASQDDGVAIAAPQIGYPLRIFVVSKKVVGIMKKEDKQPSEKAKDSVYINPILKKVSRERATVEEGCLSIRYLYGKVSRGEKATVVAYDENGKKFERGGTGLLAQIFQHEMDHLDGILFIDKAKFVEEIPPVKQSAKKQK